MRLRGFGGLVRVQHSLSFGAGDVWFRASADLGLRIFFQGSG